MIIKTPTKFFLVSGSSEGFSLLNAFDGALLASGVGDTNLVRMSSILPPGCEETIPAPVPMPQGALVPVAYASLYSDVPGEIISAAVAIGIPKDSESRRPYHGIFSESGRKRRCRAGQEDGGKRDGSKEARY